MTCYPPRSTILPNFIALRQPTPGISVTKICGQSYTHTHTQTVNDISPACLSACGDNNYASYSCHTIRSTIRHDAGSGDSTWRHCTSSQSQREFRYGVETSQSAAHDWRRHSPALHTVSDSLKRKLTDSNHRWSTWYASLTAMSRCVHPFGSLDLWPFEF